jgi:hypothetical protein
MAAFTIVEMLSSLIIGIVYYAYVFSPGYNIIMSCLGGGLLVVGQLDYNILTVLSICIVSLPLVLIIGIVIYAYDEIAYKLGLQ